MLSTICLFTGLPMCDECGCSGEANRLISLERASRGLSISKYKLSKLPCIMAFGCVQAGTASNPTRVLRFCDVARLAEQQHGSVEKAIQEAAQNPRTATLRTTRTHTVLEQVSKEWPDWSVNQVVSLWEPHSQESQGFIYVPSRALPVVTTMTAQRVGNNILLVPNGGSAKDRAALRKPALECTQCGKMTKNFTREQRQAKFSATRVCQECRGRESAWACTGQACAGKEKQPRDAFDTLAFLKRKTRQLLCKPCSAAVREAKEKKLAARERASRAMEKRYKRDFAPQ